MLFRTGAVFKMALFFFGRCCKRGNVFFQLLCLYLQALSPSAGLPRFNGRKLQYFIYLRLKPAFFGSYKLNIILQLG